MVWLEIFFASEYPKSGAFSAVLIRNFYDGLYIYSIQICKIFHQTFGPSHRKYLTCLMITVNTVSGLGQNASDGTQRPW